MYPSNRISITNTRQCIFLILVVVVGLVYGCEKWLSEPEKKVEPPLTLSAQTHTFGKVTVGDSVSWKLNIINTNNADFYIEDLFIQSSNFHVNPIDSSLSIPFNDSLVCEIWFNPQDYKDFSDSLVIKSKKTKFTDLNVHLSGTGDGIEPEWVVELYEGSTTPPALGHDGTIYVGSNNGIRAFTSTGDEKWHITIGYGGINTAPTIGEDGTIYVALDYLYAISPDGTIRWESETYVGKTSPAIGNDGTIYTGHYTPHLYAFNPDGTEKWRFATEGDVVTLPIINSAGEIFVGTSELYFHAINPDGTEKWRFQTGESIHSAPAIGSDGTIYLGTDSELYAITPDGTEKWTYNIHDIWTSLVVDNAGNVYVAAEHSLFALTPDGTLRWTFDDEEAMISSPILGADGTIFLYGATIVVVDENMRKASNDTAQNNNWFQGIYAINSDGTERYRLNADYVETSQIIGNDSMLYAFADGGILYAFKIHTSLADSPWPMVQNNPQHTGRKSN